MAPWLPPALRLGFRLIRGLGQEKIRGVVAARREGPIRSIAQLAARPDVSRDTLLRLAAADAFRSLGLDRRQALWHILALDDVEMPLWGRDGETERRRDGVEENSHGATKPRSHGGKKPGNEERGTGQSKIQNPKSKIEPVRFADPADDRDASVYLPPTPLEETVVQDYDAVGLSLNAHPIELVRAELDALGHERSHGATKPRSHEENSHGATELRSHGVTKRETERRRDEETEGKERGSGIRDRGSGNWERGINQNAKRERAQTVENRSQTNEPSNATIQNPKSKIQNRKSQISNLKSAVLPNEVLKTARHGQRVAVAGLVLVRQRPGTASGIIFMTLEDETGIANLIVRPRVWERHRAIARKPALIAEGVVERQGEVVHVMVNRLHDLSELVADVRARPRNFH